MRRNTFLALLEAKGTGLAAVRHMLFCSCTWQDLHKLETWRHEAHGPLGHRVDAGVFVCMRPLDTLNALASSRGECSVFRVC